MGPDLYYPRVGKPAGVMRYVTNGKAAAVVSRGPDADFEFDMPTLVKHLSGHDWLETISSISYDPTNGSISDGDLFVFPQQDE